jgi:selenide,water dikinase
LDLAEILKKVAPEGGANVLVGMKTCDDAGVFKLTDDLALVQTVDFITPICDDPYVFGQVAAANSLSDIYAMGAKPITALNLCCFPGSGIENQVLEAILQGGLEKIQEAGAVLIGGHTVKDDELKYGLSVTGVVHPHKYVPNSGARPGDLLILTKPIGSGVLIGAARSGRLPETVLDRVIQDMVRLNRTACEAMLQWEPHACTDITGFGLAGHAMEVARASRACVRIAVSRVPHYPEALELIRAGAKTRMTPLNRELVAAQLRVGPEVAREEEELCYDPQTSGGLLISLSPRHAEELLGQLQKTGHPEAAVIGEVLASNEPRLELVKSD